MEPTDQFIGEYAREEALDFLEEHFVWLHSILDMRWREYFEPEAAPTNWDELDPPEELVESPLGQIIQDLDLNKAELMVLILALAPHIRPQVLDLFFAKNSLIDRGFTEFGGIKGVDHSGFIPTAETALFLLGGNTLKSRVSYHYIFRDEHPLFSRQVLQPPESQDTAFSFPLRISKELLDYLVHGLPYSPAYSASFPAKRLQTKLEWDDLVVSPEIWDQINEIRNWIEYHPVLMETWKLGRLLKPGFRVLFYGPPGTGKTMTAALLGKTASLPVYRIDLSMIISKFIGETEKNLAKIFDQAQHQNWILFFDEADALFGKRTSTSSSNDRYANQEVAYLLQRVEDYPGIVVLASNLKSNIDEAFARRFQSFIHFARPDYYQRIDLWKQIFKDNVPLEKGIDWDGIAERYELTGGEIINVLRYAALKAVDQKRGVAQQFILEGVRKELAKDDRTFSPL